MLFMKNSIDYTVCYLPNKIDGYHLFIEMKNII